MATPVIYKITSPANKVYIGQTWDYRLRLNSYRALSCKKQRLIFRSLLKYGFNKHEFEVIHNLPTDISQSELNTYENVYWQFYRDAGFYMMNLQEPGNGGKHTESSKNLMSRSRMGNKNRLGKKGKLSDETRNKMSASRVGVKFSDNHKLNMSLSHGKKIGVTVFSKVDQSTKFFNSIAAAGMATGINKNNITRYLNGSRNQLSSALYTFKIYANVSK